MATVAMIALATACTPPTRSDFEQDFAKRADFQDYEIGSLVITHAGATCQPYEWRGPTASAEILSRPLLGLYAQGRKSTAPNYYQLANDDLGNDIAKRLAAFRSTGWRKDMRSSEDWSTLEWDGHNSPRFAGAPGQEVSFMKSLDMLHQIVAVMGVPTSATIPDCGQTIRLVYGDAAKPRTKTTPHQRRLKCAMEGSFLKIDITSGMYSVSSPEGCSL